MISPVAMRTRWLSISDPGFASLRSAARAAIVIPCVFAFADKVIADVQFATFAAFGSFAMLVLVEFGGRARSRLIAYLSLAFVGAADIALGTLCSRNEWLAAGAMALIGFAILFSGFINGYFAAAGTAALLPFILSATIPAPVSALPGRWAGWAFAATAAICAHMLLWPQRPQSSLQGDAARACNALADLADVEVARDPDTIADRIREADEAVHALRRRFLATPHGPTGPTNPQAALSSLVDELHWLLSLLAPPERMPGLDVCAEENAEAVAAVIEALRAAGATLQGDEVRPDLERLRKTREAVAWALVRRLPELPAVPDDQALVMALEPAFRIRALSYGARQVGIYALVASGEAAAETDDEQLVARSVRSTLHATEQLTVEHASARSVWFRNSIRAAAGLAVAVFIAERSGVQHGFWVVLGMLSVLRSNALGTGWTILSALAGTSVGIVLGAALVLGIGTHEAVLWAVLPFAVLLASYAPRAISFAAGQAGFTVVLFVLFNLLQPVGWQVGLVRLEDVAIGFAVSLGVGLLFWPRGAAGLLRQNLAFAYQRNADYVVAAERQLVEGADPDASAAAAQAADIAAHRLDDAFRQYLAERSPQAADRESIAALVAGAARLRRAGQSLSALARMADSAVRLERCGVNLDAEVQALRSWYVTLGDALVHSTTVPPPHLRDAVGRQRLLECVRDAVAADDKAMLQPALGLLWASQHLDTLWQLEAHLGRHAAGTR
ncbi:MAG: hypothetical protein QOF08_3065 [Gaiellales bacterium]|nr:hypothetical protein [Gaiellales bacterium]